MNAASPNNLLEPYAEEAGLLSTESPAMPEYLAHLAARASTFMERLGDSSLIANADQNEAALAARIDRWRDKATRGNAEQFEKLLELRELTPAQVKKGLAEVHLQEGAALPAWTSLFQEMLEACLLRSRRLDCRQSIDSGADDAALPFAELVKPFLLVAQRRLRHLAGAHYGSVGDQVHAALEAKLLFWLANSCSSTFALDFSIYRGSKGIFVQPGLIHEANLDGNEKSIYAEYVARYLAGGAFELFREYCGLARAASTLIENWAQAVSEFLQRFDADREAIGEVFFDGRDPGQVKKVEAGLSDPHRGGRSVLAVEFCSGLKVIYKPKSLRSEKA